MDKDTIYKGRTLGEILIIIFLLAMGFMRLLPQLIIIYTAFEHFLSKPFPAAVPLILSILYVFSGTVMIISVRTGVFIAAPAVALQVLADCYVSIVKYGFHIIPLLLLIYSLDILVLVYLLYYVLYREKGKDLTLQKSKKFIK
ncbi:MAG: hypothetical protein QXT06_02145 [Candidatus Bathyarchaeia archaeon]